MGYSWVGVFLLGASGRSGRFFTQQLFYDPISIYLACDLVFFGAVCYLDCILRFYDMACIFQYLLE